jgi:N-sulfoglucosamine sulfohydrolase
MKGLHGSFYFLALVFLIPDIGFGKRPNILLIVSEDNGPELGCYGDPYVQTPVLDKLAAEGVRFEKVYVPQAGCSQSRAAFLTGLYPHQNGQIGLATWKFSMYSEGTPNLVRSLKKTGYRTGIIGKLHVNPESAFPFDVHKIPSANFARKDLDAYAEEAGKFIEASVEPFFLSVNYPDPHRPFLKQVNGMPDNPFTENDVKPLPYMGLDSPDLRKQMADYYNCMSRLDSLIGDLLKVLEKSGKMDNTLIVYLGDHGADLLRGKRTSYEGGVRIPLIVYWRGNSQFQKGVRSQLVSTIDLMPTFLDVTGAEPVANLPGRSLLPLLLGAEASWRRYLFTEFHLHSAHNFYPQRTVTDGRFKLIQNLLPNEVNPGYDYAVNRFFPDFETAFSSAPDHIQRAYQTMRQPPQFELYDLQKDPFEFTNLANQACFAQDLSRLQKELYQWRKSTQDPFLNQGNLLRLKKEVEASFRNGSPQKQHLHLNYVDYFFK